MWSKPTVLSVLNIARTFARPISGTEQSKIEEYMFVAIDGTGAVTLPPFEGFFPVYMVLSRSTNEPATRTANMISLVHGKMRVLTDKILMPVQVGDPLIVANNGYLKSIANPKGKTVVGWVEQIVDDSKPLVIVCIRPKYII